MKIFSKIFPLCLGLGSPLLASDLTTAKEGFPDLRWYLRFGQDMFSEETHEPKEINGKVQLRSIKSGENLFKTNLGIFSEVSTATHRLQSRLDYIGRNESSASSWKNFRDDFDYEHFPLAWHYSERTLRANGVYTYTWNSFAFGLEGEIEDIASGSKFLNSDPSLETRPLHLGRNYFLRPTVQASLTRDDQIAVYLLNLKSIDDISRADSYETDGNLLENLGVIHRHRFENLNLASHAYRYNFIFNDPFKDFARTGMTVAGSRGFLSNRIIAGVHGSYWQDRYRLPMLGVGRCGEGFESSSTMLTPCGRTDSSLGFGFSIDYRHSDCTAVSVNYDYRSNENNEARLVEFQRQAFLLQLTFSAPSAQSVLPGPYELGREAFTPNSGLLSRFAR